MQTEFNGFNGQKQLPLAQTLGVELNPPGAQRLAAAAPAIISALAEIAAGVKALAARIRALEETAARGKQLTQAQTAESGPAQAPAQKLLLGTVTRDVVSPSVIRLQLLAAGFSPIPVSGKLPVCKGWQKLGRTNRDEIALWAKLYPGAVNTGILTARVPALDIDILDPTAADAVEGLVREKFEERGYIIPRFGQAPKRAVLFRTDAPFKKIKIVFESNPPGAPEGQCEKIELMASGQQLVAFGIHPGTGRPYSWHGAAPGEIRQEDLPYIHPEEAVALVKEITALLGEQFGYTIRATPKAKRANGGDTGPADWNVNWADHDSLTAFIMNLLRGGTHPGVVANLCKAQVGHIADPEKKAKRLKDIPGMIDSAVRKIAEKPEPKFEPKPLKEVIAAFDKWLALRDHTPIYAVLGTIAGNLLPGDPVWLGIIAPPSSAKTEILNSVSRLALSEAVATLTPAALLSGTPSRQRDKSAKGGLLRKIGEFGILVLKDFGSILSMRPDAKAETLAALREIYDGAWTRHLGTDGGRTLSWSGKIGLVFGATEAYDDHYSVVGSLGDRFLLCRLGASHSGQLKKALDHRGGTTKAMRDELAAAVGGLFAEPPVEPDPLNDQEFQRLDDVVSLVVRLRGHVNRDRYSREIESVHGAEGPGRLGLCLERLFCGLVAIGLSRKQALRIVEDVALDSTPPIRRHAFETLNDKPTPTRDIARALHLPTTTTRRALEELAAHGLANRSRSLDDESGKEKEGGADLWVLDPEWEDWAAKWAISAQDG